MKKTYAMLGLLMVAAMVLSACGGATQAPTEAMQPTAAPTEAMQPTEAPTEAMQPTEMPMPAIDCTGVNSGDEISLMYQWSGAEEEKINTILSPFVDACGVTLNAESTRDAAVLDTRVKSTPPDVLFWPSTAIIDLYGDQMQDLSALGAHTDNYASFWITDGTMGGKLVVLPAKADVKSMIWYSPAQFDAWGYAVPTTFDELNTLVEQMVADGNVPWSMGLESGDATGWTGSDFIQDLLLTQQGPDYVNSLLDGSTAYDDQGVQDAYAVYQKWASDPAYTVGGATGTVNTAFLEAIYKPFSDPPEAMMVKQSGFAGGEIVKQFPDLQYGTDFDFFQFPGAQGMQGGADYLFAFGDSPATSALIKYLTSTEGGKNWAAAGFDISPNAGAAGNYADEQLTKKADMLANATGFTPDLGDTLGNPFQSAEWKAIIDVVQGADIPTALAPAAAAQAETIGGM
jgi:alpha-glucoside transport system substrate-binding protein